MPSPSVRLGRTVGPNSVPRPAARLARPVAVKTAMAVAAGRVRVLRGFWQRGGAPTQAHVASGRLLRAPSGPCVLLIGGMRRALGLW